MEILERNKEIYTLYKSIFLKNYQLEDPNVICRRVSNLSEFVETKPPGPAPTIKTSCESSTSMLYPTL